MHPSWESWEQGLVLRTSPARLVALKAHGALCLRRLAGRRIGQRSDGLAGGRHGAEPAAVWVGVVVRPGVVSAVDVHDEGGDDNVRRAPHGRRRCGCAAPPGEE
jgi:hypothetical protein